MVASAGSGESSGISDCWTTRVAFAWTGDVKEANRVRQDLDLALGEGNPRIFREAVDRLAWLQFNKMFALGVVGVLLIGLAVKLLGLPMYGVGLSLSLSGCIFMSLLSGLRLFALKRLGRVQFVAYRSVVYVSVAPLIGSSMALFARWP